MGTSGCMTPSPPPAQPPGRPRTGDLGTVGLGVRVAADLVGLQRGLSTEEALERLRRHARRTGRSLDDVASDVVDGAARLPR